MTSDYDFNAIPKTKEVIMQTIAFFLLFIYTVTLLTSIISRRHSKIAMGGRLIACGVVILVLPLLVSGQLPGVVFIIALIALLVIEIKSLPNN